MLLRAYELLLIAPLDHPCKLPSSLFPLQPLE